MGAESSNNIFVALRDSGANTEDERSHMTEVSQLVGSLNNTFSQSEQRVETIFPHDRGQSSTQLTRPVTQQVDTYDYWSVSVSLTSSDGVSQADIRSSKGFLIHTNLKL